MNLLEPLRAAVSKAQAATTSAEVGKVYEALVGYDAHEDDPSATLEDLRSLVFDYVREVCYAESIPCSDAGLTDASTL